MSAFDFFTPPARRAETLPEELGTEFYETPWPFTRWLLDELAPMVGVHAPLIVEPCVGRGAIVGEIAQSRFLSREGARLVTNDLDPYWSADYHQDAADPALWAAIAAAAGRPVDLTISNTPFGPWQAIAETALAHTRACVALHLRGTVHEVMKTGAGRTWMATHPPTGILWLPRFAYQRSKTSGKWSQDSVAACWVIWLRGWPWGQFIRYAPEWVLDALEAETVPYRRRMDAVMACRLSARHAAERGTP